MEESWWEDKEREELAKKRLQVKWKEKEESLAKEDNLFLYLDMESWSIPAISFIPS